jgi:hypothetical protein
MSPAREQDKCCWRELWSNGCSGLSAPSISADKPRWRAAPPNLSAGSSVLTRSDIDDGKTSSLKAPGPRAQIDQAVPW